MNAETTENVNAETKNENAKVSEEPKKTSGYCGLFSERCEHS